MNKYKTYSVCKNRGNKSECQQGNFLLTQITFFLLTFNLICNVTNAQQMPVYNHFNLIPVTYNPAEISNSEFTEFYLISRRQWVGIDDAPESNFISITGPIDNKKIGVGGSFFHNKTNIVNRLGGYGHYSYKFTLPKKHNISLSLSLGFLQNNIAFNRLQAEDEGEAILFSQAHNATNFDAGTGFLYSYKTFKAGFSAFHLTNSNFIYQNSTLEQKAVFSLTRHFYGYVSYKHQLAANFNIEPLVFMRNVQGMPAQFDAQLKIDYQNKIWVSTAWQQSFGFNLMAGGVINNRITLSYSYSVSTGNMAKYNNGTHEAVLGFRIFGPPKGPVKFQNMSDEEIEKQVEMDKEQFQEIEKLQQKDKVIEKELDESKEKIDDQLNEMEMLKKIFEDNGARVDEIIKKYNYEIRDIDTIRIDTTVTIETENTTFYIVVGSFLKISDAKLFQRILRRDLGLITFLTSKEDEGLYFVYTHKYKNTMGVDKKVNREIKMLEKKGIGKYLDQDIWLYYDNY